MVGEAPPVKPAWQLRDTVAAVVLMAATAGTILWQCAHVAVLWDLGYVLDSAARMAAGQVPYRDFPFVHSPLTFLVQAAIMRWTGRVYTHQIAYVTAMGAASTVIAWRIVLRILRERFATAWVMALLLAVPLAVLGTYCIFPFPSYDCDGAFWILVALWCWQRCERAEATSSNPPSGFGWRGYIAGVAVCVPLFFKQNMGLPFLLAALGSAAFVFVSRWAKTPKATADRRVLATLIAGACAALLAAALLLQHYASLGNFVHWTVVFAGQRRLPGLAAMAGIYGYPSLAWQLPCVVMGAEALLLRLAKKRWTQIAAFALMAAPFLWTLAALVLYDDADERGDALAELWPLILALAAVAAVVQLVSEGRKPTLRLFLPFLVLAAVHGTMMSQQLWGSNYAIWPLLTILAAGLLRQVWAGGPRWIAPALAATIGVTLLVCGAFYTASEERLNYVQLPDGPAEHSSLPALTGMATPGPYLPEFDEVLSYAAAQIPRQDGVVTMPGDEPFFFASGRAPQFPVTLFDPTTDPYSPEQTAALMQSRGIRWLIVKRDLQILQDVTPNREATMQLLMKDYALAARLRGYDVYRRNATR